MASYNELKALIDAYIYPNGVQAITGQILNGVLKAIVDQVGAGYNLMGVAHPSDDPGTPDAPSTWFAYEAGTYADFGGANVTAGELAIISSDGLSWTKQTIFPGIQSVAASVDDQTGTPSVTPSYDPTTGALSFAFHNMKGAPGDDGDAAGFGTIGATVDDTEGTPAVSVQESGPNTAKNLSFQFTGLKGKTGVTSVLVTVDDTVGTPSCAVSLSGQVLSLAFTGLKGAQGDTGSSVDYPFTIVNNLTTNDATQALSAAQGKVLKDELTQLEAKLPMLGGYLVPLLRKVVYKDDDAESLINGINALLNTIELTSITAVYTQPGTIYAGQSLDDLKNGLVVTANYNDGTSVEVNDYELSGTLTAGTSSIVVTYQEKTTTFNVTVTDAVYYKDGSLLPGRVGLRNSFTSAGQSAAYVKDNVKYVFTNDFAKSGSTTPKKRCAYYLFDILLTAGKNYRHIIEFESSLTSSQFIQVSLAYYDETYRVAGVENVDTPQDYSNNVQATSWLSTTKDGSSVYMDDIAPSGYVGGRISLRLVNSSNVEQDWPTTLTVKRYIIQEVE